ncbi:MAG: hypothetical protein Q8N09_12250 [Thermodesulfovibrionia bacterium]|nr:hypothetical protein [Thermodesulfovibrionia bacterium]
MKLKKSFLFIAILFLFYAVYLSAEPLQFDEWFFIAKPVSGMQRYPAVAYAKNVYLVVWQEGHYGWGPPADTGIKGVRISDAGRIIDNESFIISNAQDFQERPVIATDGEMFLVVWQDFRNGKDYDIYAARVTTEGKILDIDGIPITKARSNQCNPSAAFDGKNFVVAWMDNRDIEQSYHIRASRVGRNGVVFDSEGITVAGYDEKYLKGLMQSNNLKGLPLNSFPKIACNKGDCLVGWISKTQPWKESPAFKHIITEPEIKLNSDTIVIPSSDVLENSRAGSPEISIAANGNKYMAVYSGIQGKGGGSYFIIGVSFYEIDKIQKSIKPLKIRPWQAGYKLSKFVTPYDKGFVVIWSEGNHAEGKSPIEFTMKGVYIDKNDQTSEFEVFPLNDSYRGYPFLFMGSRHGLLVYEEFDKNDGMRIIGRIMRSKEQ